MTHRDRFDLYDPRHFRFERRSGLPLDYFGGRPSLGRAAFLAGITALAFMLLLIACVR